MRSRKLFLGVFLGLLAVSAAAQHGHHGSENGGYYIFVEGTASGTPAANQLYVYAKDKTGVSALYLKRDDGSEVDLTAAGGSGAPTDATYITQTANASLSAEQAMGALTSGLVSNTTTTGVQSIYAGTSCTNQFPRSLDASGAATCATVQDADIVAALSRDAEAPAAGDITGSLSAGYQIGSGAVGTAEVSTALKTQQWGYALFDTATDLPATLDITSIIANRARAVTLTEIYCEIDAGSATINLQRDDGTPANILAADLVCSTSGATGTPAAAEDNVAVGEEIDHVTVSVGAGLRRLTVAIKYTVD